MLSNYYDVHLPENNIFLKCIALQLVARLSHKIVLVDDMSA